MTAPTNPPTGGVLAGIEVLDLSWGIAGPMTTMLLSDHGARVTKIEPPGGDPFRAQAGYRVWNRGKRSAVLDLKADADRAAFLALAERADVVLESFSPGATERLGIDYVTLSRANPRLVYCSITGYGHSTRDADRPGYDALIQARTGMQWDQMGWPGFLHRMAGTESPVGDVDIPDDALERPLEIRPRFVASRWPSLVACYLATIGISSALYVREQTGRGQHVETSLLQGAIGASLMVWQRAENTDVDGFASWVFDARGPKGIFQCADGRWVCYCPPSVRFVKGASEGDELTVSDQTVSPRSDPDRFSVDQFELPVVLQHFPALRDAFRKFPADEWVRLAASVRVPIAHVLSPAEALSDRRYLADGCVVEVDDPEQGRVRQCGIVYHLDTSPGRVQGPPPAVGQHTAEVRAEAARTIEHRPAADEVGAEHGRGPLAGIRVLDFGAATAGPFGAQLLSDLGADVIRVNAPNQDFLIGHQFICAGRGKRAITINLKDPRGREIVHRLVEKADVVHLNIGQNTVKRLGIDFETLREINPRLVYCHTGGYERSERSNQPSNDPIACSIGGVNWADGGSDDGGPPFWSVTAVGDTGNGFLSAVAVVQALYDRERTGLGQHVDTSLVYVCLLNTSYTYLREDGTEGERHKVDRDQLGLSALYRLYETSDGWLCLAAVTEDQWNALGRAIERDDLLRNPRFGTSEDRDVNDDDLTTELVSTFAKRAAAEWFDLLDAAGVPVEVSDPMWPVRMFDDPELVERGWVVEYEHPLLGRFDQHGILCDFSETPCRVAGRPPMLGEHTTEILTELGYGAAEIDGLEGDDVVQRWASEA